MSIQLVAIRSLLICRTGAPGAKVVLDRNCCPLLFELPPQPPCFIADRG